MHAQGPTAPGEGPGPRAGTARTGEEHPVLRPISRLAVGVLALAVLLLPELAPAADAQVPARAVPMAAADLPEGRASAQYPYLTGPQFLAIFDGLWLDDTTPASGPAPVITGNATADARIRWLAEQRGYRRRPASTGHLAPVDGQLLHPTAADALRQLQAAAAADGIAIRAVSGYRSPDTQRTSFLSRLAATPAQVAAGTADGAVDAVLAWVAAPGYSKHQTGYAVDLVQAGGTVDTFGGSAAFRWMAADNYRNARRFGFLPSYPPDGGAQGPNPEPWEYVFVGTDHSRADSPVGALEMAEAVRYGRALVAGWAVDASHPTLPVEVHVYVGGTVGTPGAVGTNLGPASLFRPDIGGTYTDAGSSHGFNGFVATGSHQGRVPVCAYGIDRAPGATRLLGCRDVQLVPGTPVGAIDAVTGGPRELRAQGWVLDPDGDGPTDVHLYVDGVGVANVDADLPRPDVAASYPGHGTELGFDHVLEAEPGWRTLCAYGINLPGTTGGNVHLGCRQAWVVDPDAAFVDLLSDGRFHAAIAHLADLGVIGGYPDGTFRPTAPVSRQAAVAFLHRLAGTPEPTGTPTFPDVPADHRFATEVAWAAEEGAVDGYGDGTFRPTAPVSRQALVAVLWRLTGEPEADFQPVFADVAEDHRFAAAIAWAYAAGLVEGYDDGMFRPTAPVSRQAAAAILDRVDGADLLG